ANRPQVLFTSPSNGQRVTLGGRLEVKTLLVDSELNFMISRLYDTSRTEKRKYRMRTGGERIVEVPASLDPIVVVTRANGEKVAEGVMPFG
ncbi:MAG: hypothetical protein JSW47_13555, partial [Phycisphaerales bacterium]